MRLPDRLFLTMDDLAQELRAMAKTPSDSVTEDDDDDDDFITELDGLLPMHDIMNLGVNAADFFVGVDERLNSANVFVAVELTGKFITSMTQFLMSQRVALQPPPPDGE